MSRMGDGSGDGDDDASAGGGVVVVGGVNGRGIAELPLTNDCAAGGGGLKVAIGGGGTGGFSGGISGGISDCRAMTKTVAAASAATNGSSAQAAQTNRRGRR